MFQGFANVWTPVELARRVGRKPYALTLAGERVVVFRDRQGKLGALLDRCPHRGVALSLGKVDANGCLECPFHGWTFAGDGACTHVPMNAVPEAKRARLGATALPVREAGGFVWLRTSPGKEAPDEPEVPEQFTAPGWHRWVGIKTWKTHWTRAMENMLDAPHLPFVHRRTIGMGLRRAMTRQSVMEVGLEQTPSGFRSDWRLDGASDGAFLEFTRPNKMGLGVPFPGKKMMLHVWCVPVDAEHTRMIVASTRNFGVHNPLMRLFDLLNHLIIHEDQAVVESSQPSEVPRPGTAEVSVATDRATLAFRTYYLGTLKPSVALPPKQPAPLEQPAPVSDALPAAGNGAEAVAPATASAPAELAERLSWRA